VTPEPVERRVLGAIRFLDAVTLTKVSEGLRVQSAQADLRRNRSGLWVIWAAAGLDAHTAAFERPPALPAVETVPISLTVTDNATRFLARSATVKLPRDPDPANAEQPSSLFQPADVRLYPGPTAPVSPGWAVIRARVENANTGAALAGALIRVLRTPDDMVLARGMSDDRGEALVVVPGIPITTFSSGDGAVLATEVTVTVRATFDPAAGGAPDPDAMEKRADLPSSSSSQKLAAGRTLVAKLAVTVP
jgi:hypothetical protein